MKRNDILQILRQEFNNPDLQETDILRSDAVGELAIQLTLEFEHGIVVNDNDFKAYPVVSDFIDFVMTKA